MNKNRLVQLGVAAFLLWLLWPKKPELVPTPEGKPFKDPPLPLNLIDAARESDNGTGDDGDELPPPPRPKLAPVDDGFSGGGGGDSGGAGGGREV